MYTHVQRREWARQAAHLRLSFVADKEPRREVLRDSLGGV
jgi:hypothetical protein